MTEVKGDGAIVSREISVSSFLRLHLLVPGLIEICQSQKEKVIIDADENLMGYFEAESSGRTLYISSGSKFKKPVFSLCRISIFLRNIDSLNISHEDAMVFCRDEMTLELPLSIKIREARSVSMAVAAPSISILNQAGADVSLVGRCHSLNIRIEGGGGFDSRQLQAEEVQLRNMANGEVRLHANKLLAIDQLGDGPVYYSGKAVLRDITIRGKGEVKPV